MSGPYHLPNTTTPPLPRRPLLSRVGLVVFLVLLAVGVLVFGVVAHIKAKVVVAGSVTLAYDPLTGQLSVSADPLGFVTKWVTVKVGDELKFGSDPDKVTVSVVTATSQAAFELPEEGSWNVRAEDVAGPGLSVDYNASARQLRIDLSRVFVRTITLNRSDGKSGWDEAPQVTKVSTHPVTVDTSLLTTGDYTYCKDAQHGCGIYLYAIAARVPGQRVMLEAGDPISIPNGTRLEAICEAGGEAVRNDYGVSSRIWEYVLYNGHVGYVPAIWTGTYDKQIVRVCGQ